MKRVFKVASDGLYVEDVLLNDGEAVPHDCTEVEIPEVGLYHPRLVSGKWVEGMPQTEIDALKAHTPPKSELEQLRETVDQLVLDNLMRGF